MGSSKIYMTYTSSSSSFARTGTLEVICHMSGDALCCRYAPDKSGPAHPTSAWFHLSRLLRHAWMEGRVPILAMLALQAYPGRPTGGMSSYKTKHETASYT